MSLISPESLVALHASEHAELLQTRRKVDTSGRSGARVPATSGHSARVWGHASRVRTAPVGAELSCATC